MAEASLPTMVAAWRCSRQRVVSGALVPPFSSSISNHVGDQHVIVRARVAGPGGGVAGVRVDQPGRLGRQCFSASASAALFGQVVQIAQRGVPLGVHDGVHVLGPPEHPQFGHRLVGGDDQLHARPLGRHQALTGHGICRPARPVEGVVGGVVDRTDKTEGRSARAAPGERGFAPGPVVVEGRAGEVVAALDDGFTVVVDRLRSHHPHPGHARLLPHAPGGGCNRVQGNSQAVTKNWGGGIVKVTRKVPGVGQESGRKRSRRRRADMLSRQR